MAQQNVLAGRIQGFGNVNPPPLEEETGSTVAKRAVSRLGDMVGEEVMLTVEDFREKGAVGAVKDAVADAGDILIDGVSGLIGWIRGEPPAEEESEKTEDATKALSNGPSGAAYGISQASPTGGINAVWVMPDEADPQALASLAQQQGGLVPQAADPRVPKNIQPYQPPPGKNMPAPAAPQFPMAAGGYAVPGGPVIAPYQPAPSGPGARPPPFIPGPGGSVPGAGAGAPGFQQGRWGPGGYSSASPPTAPSASTTGAKALVERIAKGEVIMGPEVAKRLMSQCTAVKTTGKQLGEMICERTRRLYLGLDGGDPADADAALARLLGLAAALAQQGADAVAKGAVEEIKKGVPEELMSLRCSAKYKDTAEPMLRTLGLLAKAAPTADLLGGGSSAAAPEADLLGGSAPAPAAKEADLLGGMEADLLGGASSASAVKAPSVLADTAPSGGLASLSLDPLGGAPAGPASASGSSSLLGGLKLDSAPAPVSPGSLNTAAVGVPAMSGTMGAGAVMSKATKKDEDIFGFVGAEMSKASTKP